MALHHYHAFGISIASEIELPELHRGLPPADVEVRRAAIEAPAQGAMVEPSPGRVLFRLENQRFLVEAGRTIRIDAPPGTPSNDIRIWLLGTVMAALLHQRAYLPIHANVIALAQRSAAAFAGESGAGKSMLAAWFEARGHRVLADDLCAIRSSGTGIPQLFDGIPRLKLWQESLAALGRSAEGLEKVASDLDKFHVPLARSVDLGSLEPRNLERIYLLGRTGEGGDFGIERLSGGAAAHGILANAFRWGLGQQIHADPSAQFRQCIMLARHAAVFDVRRRWSLRYFEEEALAIERHLAAPL